MLRDSNLTTRETLERAREYISDITSWKKGEIGAIDGSYCAMGAVGMAASGSLSGWEKSDAALFLAAAISDVPYSQVFAAAITVARYNDTHDHACVLQMFDAAIERLVVPYKLPCHAEIPLA